MNNLTSYINWNNYLIITFTKGVKHMIKTKKELMAIGFLGYLSTVLSYIFTISMLMTFAETTWEKCLYFCCGVVIDGVKWFALLTLIKYHRAKLYNQFVSYFVLFLFFASISVIASVSFSIYTVKKQMYDVTQNQNPLYVTLQDSINNSKGELNALNEEKNNELARLNTELDSLPLDYITRRQELSNKKIELIGFYDNKITALKTDYDNKVNELNTIDSTPQELKKLKNNPIAGFFETISNAFNIQVDSIIMFFAIMLGVALDVASIAFTFDRSYSYENKRSFNKHQTVFKNLKLTDATLKTGSDDKILNFDDFIQFVNKNDLDIDSLKYSQVSDYISKTSFYRWMDQYKNGSEEQSEKILSI